MCYRKRIGGKFGRGKKRNLKKELIETIDAERERGGKFLRMMKFLLLSFLGSNLCILQKKNSLNKNDQNFVG